MPAFVLPEYRRSTAAMWLVNDDSDRVLLLDTD